MTWKKELRDFIDGFFGDSVMGSGGLGFFGARQSESGADVNEQSSMTVGAVAACQRIISSAFASMNCYVYERIPGGHNLAVKHPLFDTLSLRPNADYPAVDFYSAGMVNLLQHGNAYAEILSNGAGYPAALQLLSPFRTYPRRDPKTSKIYYLTTDTPTGIERRIEAEDMIHVKNMGVSPYIGLSPIRLYMREVIGTALAAQAYGARLFKNDARPGGYLKSDATVKEGDKLAQIQSWVSGHTEHNNHTVAYLDGGVSWQTVGINPDEAQFLQTRQFQRSEIASIYGVPAHMLGDPQETKATIEQKALEFLLWTIKIWNRRWEHALNVKLFPTVGQSAGKFFAKFDTSEFERSDYATMLKGLQTGRYAGLINIQEGRKQLGLNPATPDMFDGTDPALTLFRPVNMAIMSDDPALNAVQGTPGGDAADPDKADPPAEDEPNTTGTDGEDDTRGLERHLGRFEANLDQIAALSKPNAVTLERILMPSFEALAGHQSVMVAIIARGFVNSLMVNGVQPFREQLKQILIDFKAQVGAISAPEGEL